MCPWTACKHAATAATGRALDFVRKVSLHARPLGAAFLLLLLAPVLARAEGVWDPLVRRLAADGFNQAEISGHFARPDVRFDPLIMARKMNALLDVKLAIGKPKPETPEIYSTYLNPLYIFQARMFMREQATPLAQVRARYGVPPDILVALLLVETKLGRNVGSRGALATLASMALAGDFSLVAPHIERKELPPEMEQWLRWRTAQKAAWAYKELKALLVYAKGAGFEPATIPGSVYGAIGICQFMPTNAVRYGADLDGDGRVDLFSPTDSMLSAARFLSVNGWKAGMTRERQMQVLYRYNHSHVYTRTIMAVADRLREAD